MKAVLLLAIALIAICSVTVSAENVQQYVPGKDVDLVAEEQDDVAKKTALAPLTSAKKGKGKGKNGTKELSKAVAALGPAYIAMNQALGPRTQAYLNNFLQALGQVPTVGFFRNLYADMSRQQYISFVRQYCALYGGASGYQLAQYIRQFGSPSTAAAEFAAFYKAIGAPLLIFLQQLTVSTGGRASQRPANLAVSIFNQNGEATTITALQNMLSSLSSRPKFLGSLIGRVMNNLSTNDFITLVKNNLQGAVNVVNAAANSQSIPFFDFTSLTTSTSGFDVAGAATIIINSIKNNNYF